MKLISKTKQKIINYSLGIGIPVIIAAAVVGGYYSSLSANPYKEYYRSPSSDAVPSFLASFYSATLRGARALVLPGYTLVDPLNAALENASFNKTGFFLVDEAYYGDCNTQVASVQFRADEGSFVSGIALAMYLNDYKEYFSNNDNKLTWATYGGDPYDAVLAFMSGFQKGIDWFNKTIVPKNPNYLPIEQMFISDQDNDNFSHSFGPSDGNAIIDKFLIKGVDCLIPVAGPQSIDAAAKISIKIDPRTKQPQRTIVVGVDSAMEDDKKTKNYKLPQVKGIKCPKYILPFSSMKKIDQILPIMFEKTNEGTPAVDNIGGLGYHSIGNIHNNGAGVSPAGEQYVVEAIKLLSPSVSNYNQAIEYIATLPDFINLAKKDPGEDNLASGIYNLMGIDYKYSVYTKGFLLPTLPDKKPVNIPDSKMTQAQWDEKKTFNLKGFVQKGNQKDSDKIKLILSSANSILHDAGFCQVSYLAIYYFYKKNDINIPII